jgi:hypothetical protein
MGHITSISTPEQEDNRPERNGSSVCREEQVIQLIEKDDKSVRLNWLKRFSNDIQNCLWGNLNAHKLLRKWNVTRRRRQQQQHGSLPCVRV